MNLYLERLSKKARELTDSPGVYIMKNKKGEIIYIGKAKVLKNRVSSYFQPNNPSHNEKVRKMVSQVYDFDYIVVNSEFEALVLECSLIKQNNPKYNILLKDDKGYHYIKITKDDYPKFSAEKMLGDKNAEYLGPYTSSFSVKQSVDEVNKIFKLPTCNKKFPQDMKKERPCLNFYIKQCMGVCRGNITKDVYGDIVSQAKNYLKKGGNQMVSRLTAQMEEAAEALDFEKAADLRDRIAAIKKIADTQKVYMINSKEQDVLAFALNNTTAAVAVLKFRNSKLCDKDDFILTDVYDLDTARQEFLNQYYLQNNDVPKRIVIDKEFEGKELLSDFLTDKFKKKIEIIIPYKGESKKIVDMAYDNASEKLSKKVQLTGHDVSALEELQKLLGLQSTPSYIEAYDISNMGDSSVVGGMVVFENAKPLKKAYRKFKIKEVVGQDDYASMREVLNRRLDRYLKEKDTGEGFGRLPDLILLDGGKGHVAAIEPIIAQKGLNIPIFGMVKDLKHRTRAIAKSGDEITVSGNKSAFFLITRIQDEVHRYAINYQKNVHKKTSFELMLTRIDGIGEKKATALIRKFKTKKALKELTVEQLKKEAKISEKTAQELYDYIAML